MKPFPYVTRMRDRHGRERFRFRRKGVDTYLPAPWGSPAFLRAYREALAKAEGSRAIVKGKALPGSVSALIAAYYESAQFAGLKPSTRAAYRMVLEPFRERHADKAVSLMQAKHLQAELDHLSATPHAAQNWFKRWRRVLDYGVKAGVIDVNISRSFDSEYKPGKGFEPWPDELIAQYQERHPVGSMPRLAFDLLLFTGQRRSDVVTMSKSNIRDGSLRVVQVKTGNPLWIPIHRELQASIAQTPSKCTTILCTEYGKPFTAKGFGAWFKKHCERANIPAGYSAHGLRKAAGRRLAEAGCSTRQIMSVLGHKSLSEAERYTRDADQLRLAREAMEKIG